ncbi:RusA family crossover junction endodeoxyribonuclease [Dichelobacter nodosus]|uniref:RusA family crossover junction endodeoxyribonuclease n=1 Tax=Dichelobacter nodosus TaxID=870 RepID=UPI0006826C25|nr:RusA family crossover junction endodeoxyribonuclease [Dichelobacter nodosus]KNZ40109.1 hypothetical protein AKG33_00045 [Dichelobacter nodosus]
MSVHTFKALLPMPPSVNHYYRRRGSHVYLSDEARVFRRDVILKTIGKIPNKNKRWFGKEQRLAMTVTLYPTNRRSFDIDNRLKALLDVLQEIGVYHNDNQIDDLRVVRGAVVKRELGFCVVEVKPC